MSRDSKDGDKATPTVTLRGRQLEVVNAVASEMGVDPPEAIRAILERWITSDEGARTLLESYRIDVRGPEAKVLQMKTEQGDR